MGAINECWSADFQIGNPLLWIIWVDPMSLQGSLKMEKGSKKRKTREMEAWTQ